MYAARIGNANLCKLFIDHGASVNKKSKDNRTPLMFASRTGSLETCRLLVKKGAQVNCINDAGNSPLCLAARAGNPKVVDLLLNNEAYSFVVNNKKETALLRAAQSQNILLTNRLLIGLFEYSFKKVYSLIFSLKQKASEWPAESVEEQAPHLLYKHRIILVKEYIQDVIRQELSTINQYLDHRDSKNKRAHDYLNLSHLHPGMVRQTEEKLRGLVINKLEAAQQLIPPKTKQQKFKMKDGYLQWE